MSVEAQFLSSPISFLRSRPPFVLLAIGLAAAGLAAGLGAGEALAFGLLGLLAAAGALAFLAAAAGFLRAAWPGGDEALAAAAAQAAAEGFVVSAQGGRIAYSNAAWLAMAGARAQSVERAFSREENGAAAVYRLAEAARKGRIREETVRLDRRLDGRPGGALYRLRVAPLPKSDLAAWTVAEIDPPDPAPPAPADSTLRAPQSGEDGLFANAFDHAPFGVATVDRDGRIRRRNLAFARMFADARTGSARDLTSEPAALLKAVAAAASGRNAAPIEAPLAGEGGRSGRFYVGAIESGVEGEGIAALFALDITAERALANQVAESRKMQAIGELAGGVAHDFNNMLTAILGHCDFLLADRRPGDPSFRDIMQIKQNANRAAGLVRQLLAFSRRQVMHPEPLAIDDALGELSILIKGMLGVNVSLDLVRGRDLWGVMADMNQFEQAIVNLAVNARDAMPDGGALTLRTANVRPDEVAAFGHPGLPPAEYVLIEATDTGPGIPPAIKDKIFEPFFSTKAVGKGTGLGLSSVYGTVRQSGGYVFVDSPPGRGATFRIFLPRHVPDAKAAEPVRKEAPALDLTGRGVILLVEDETAVRAIAARALQARGYGVIEAATGAEALAVMQERGAEVDLLVSDVVMPEMDGPALLKKLRVLRPDLKTIFVSGYAKDAFEGALEGEGDFRFLPKPFTLKDLARAVKETLG